MARLYSFSYSMTQEEFFKRYAYSPSRDRIGGGGFGTVYKAYDNLLHREVATKVSEVKTTVDGKKTFSLKDEFEALAHVPKHPNIANYEEFYSFEMPNGIFDYAVMQYYPDGNLSNAIKIGLTAEQKEDVATQLLEGIDFLHKHKVVHRDLKPGNILIVKHGGRIIPLITDFGLSKATGMGENSMFSNSFGGGTPRYSSPEQLQGNPLRFNTDLWSYGAILYELFTGEQLFTAGSGAVNTAQADMEIYNKIVNGNVQSLGKMPEKWRKVAERCLVVDPTKRAKDAVELFAIIKGDEDETIGSSPGSGITKGPKMPANTPPIDKPSPKAPHSGLDPLSSTPNDKPKSKKGLWIGLGIAAAVILALLLLLKPKQKPTPSYPDTQAYEACQTVADYRAYISDYGRNSMHYADAKAFVDQYVADSIGQARQAQAMADAAQKEEAERQAQAKAKKKEDDAYKKCTTIAACEYYLKSYPQGRYEAEVSKKKTELEQAQQAQQGGNGIANGHEWVDLGLPSGTLWATCNVGASNPEDYGSYFAWGETSTKSTYNWETYKFAIGNYESIIYVFDGETGVVDRVSGKIVGPKLTKYCNKSDFNRNGYEEADFYSNNGFADNLTCLQKNDDPSVSWGDRWITPSKDQWEELTKYTNSRKTTKNGVVGTSFTSKKNGNTIFLPKCGCIEELRQRIGYGVYWTRTLSTYNPFCAFYFVTEEADIRVSDLRGYRFYGFSVRPVRQK